MRAMWKALPAAVTRHPARVVLAVVAVVALLAVGLPRLEFVTGQETMVDPGTDVSRINERYQDTFGGEPMPVLLTGDIRDLTTGDALAGPLVIAVGTEFSVLVVVRYTEERQRGRDPRESVSFGVPRIGRAFVASGFTLVGGFGVLAFSPVPLLRDFGIVVALDVLFALASTLILLPPLLVWADGHGRLGGTRPSREAVSGADDPDRAPVGGS